MHSSSTSQSASFHITLSVTVPLTWSSQRFWASLLHFKFHSYLAPKKHVKWANHWLKSSNNSNLAGTEYDQTNLHLHKLPTLPIVSSCFITNEPAGLGAVPFVFTSKKIHPFQMVTHFFPLGCPYQIWISIPKLGPSMVPWRSRHGTRGWMISDMRLDLWWFFVRFLLRLQKFAVGFLIYIYRYIQLVKTSLGSKHPTPTRCHYHYILMQLQQESLSEVSDSSSRKMWTLEMS